MLTIKAGQEAGSGEGDEQLTPTADQQPMVLWEREGLPPLGSNGLGGLADKGDDKVAENTVELEQVNISLKPEEPKRSPSPQTGTVATQKAVDDDTLTRRRRKADEEATVKPSKEKQEGEEADVEAVKEEAVSEATKQETVKDEAQVVNAEPEKTALPVPSVAKGPASEAKPTAAGRKVSPSSKPSGVEAKKPPPRAAGSVAGRPSRPKSMADAKEMSPVRPAVPAKPVLGAKKTSQLRASVSPGSSKESSPVHQVRETKEVSPNSSGGVASKKDATAGRGVTAKPKTAVTPGKSPARQPVAAGMPRGRGAAKTGNGTKSGGSPSRGTAAKPRTGGSPSHSPNMKRKAESSAVKAAPSRLAQEGLPVEKPIARVRSDETNNSSPTSQKERLDKEGGGPEAQTDKGDGEVAKKKSDPTPKGAAEAQKRRRRRISSASTGR